MTSTAVEDCILSVDSIIRLGGAVADDDSDDESERIQTALEKYGLHFEGQEARILEDRHGNYVGSSLPILFKGSFKENEKMSLNHFLARHSPNEHYCCVPGCKEPMIKSSENKYSNGQAHIRRHHPELVPFSLWSNAMLRIREAAWTEQKTSFVKRKASSQEGAEKQVRKKFQKQAQFTFAPTVAAAQRKSTITDFALILVKFVCLGLFPIAVTNNPGFAYLIRELTNNVKLSAPNTIQRRLLKEFENLTETRKALLAEVKINELPEQSNEIDLDPHIYHRIFSLQYDCWTNRSSESFLGLTLFYISKDWELIAISLGCVPFGGSHTALKTRDLIEEVDYEL